jgi:hypothetical protein
MSSTMTTAVSPPVIFANLLAPANREVRSNLAAFIIHIRIVLTVLGILAFCIIAHWISKKFVSWYINHLVRAKEHSLCSQEHIAWMKWVRGSWIDPQAPQLPAIEDPHIEDIELGLRCANSIDSVQVHRRNRSLRNSQNPPENVSIKATNVYVPGDILQSNQISAIVMSPAVPLALRFQKQGQFGEKFDHHVPLAPRRLGPFPY